MAEFTCSPHLPDMAKRRCVSYLWSTATSMSVSPHPHNLSAKMKAWGKQTHVEPPRPRSHRSLQPIVRGIIVLWGIWFLFRKYVIFRTEPSWTPGSLHRSSSRCPQAEPLFPSQTTQALDSMDDFLTSETFLNKSIERLS